MSNRKDEVSLAYQILKQGGQALYFRELIAAALHKGSGKSTKLAPSPQLIAEVHTQINMDSRFVHTGKGMWGLAEWTPRRGLLPAAEEAEVTVPQDNRLNLRREKLFAAIQQDDEIAASRQEHELNGIGLDGESIELEDDEEMGCCESLQGLEAKEREEDEEQA